MMYDLSNETENNIAQNQFNHLVLNERIIELSEIKKTRSNLQNAALHQFFVIISNEINNVGLEFNYEGLKGDVFGVMYTPEIVKNFIWRPIQITLFNTQSTKLLTTSQINKISDVLIKYFGEKGIKIVFPDFKTKLDKESINLK